MRLKAIVAYDGTNYYGFQIQNANGYPSIEDALNKAISLVTKEEIKVVGQGRTDKGVHALNFVFHFDTLMSMDNNSWVRAINTFLNEDIRIKEVKEVDDSFHARFSAKSKEYHYHILTSEFDLFKKNYVGFYDNLDLDLIEKGLKKLLGTHDFRGFSGSINSNKNSVRTIYEAKVKVEGDHLEFIFVADSFLKYMVRRMMGALVFIGQKKAPLSLIDEIFYRSDSAYFGHMVTSSGLYLVKVNYDSQYE